MKDRRITWYLVLSFSLSWAIALAFALTGAAWNSTVGLLAATAYMFMPAVAAIALQRKVDREPVRALGVSFSLNRWYGVAWLLPPVLAAAACGIALLIPGVSWSPGLEGMIERYRNSLTPEQVEQLRSQMAALRVHPFFLGLAQGLIAGATVNAVAGFGEEIGWRGYLFKLLAPLGFWRMSLATGLIWGAWHAPLIVMGHNYPQHPHIGIGMMIAWCVLLSPLFTYIRIRSGSVIAVSILHGTLNGTAGLAILLLAGGSDLTIGLTGAAGFIALIFANAAMVIHDRRFSGAPVTAGNRAITA